MCILTLLIGCSAVFAVGINAHGGAPVDLSPAERAWLDDNPDKLVLYFEVGFPPLEFLSESGTFAGFGADIMDRLETLLEVQFIREPSYDWNALLDALEDGSCALTPTIVSTEEREVYILFTNPYATIPVVILTTTAVLDRVTLADLAGQRVSTVSGYVAEADLRKSAKEYQFEILPVANVQEGLLLLAAGQTDAFVGNVAVAGYYIDRLGIANVRVAGETDLSYALSIGVSRKYPLLYSAVNKALAQISEEEIAAFRAKWISLEMDTGLPPRILLILQIAVFFVAALFASLALITVLLKRSLARKTADLRMSEAKYKRLAENSPAVVYQLKRAPDGTFSYPYLNEFVLDMTGVSAEAAMEDPFTLLNGIHPDDMRASRKEFLESATTLKAGRVTFRYLKGEEERWFEAHSTPEHLPSGEVVWEGFAIDITKRVRAERELARRVEFERLVARASYEFVSEAPDRTDIIIDRVLKTIGVFASADRAYLFLFRSDGNRMDNSHEWCGPGIESQKDNLQGLLSDDVAWWVNKLRARETIYVPSVDNMPSDLGREKEILKAQDIKSVVVVPLLAGDVLLGFLGVDSVRTLRKWTETEQDLLRLLGSTMVHALLRRDAENTLRESEERFRSVLQNVTSVAVQGYRVDGTVQYWNHASELLYGYSEQEALGQNLLDLIVPESMQGWLREKIREMAETGRAIPASELLLNRKDGTRVEVFSNHVVIHVPGYPLELFCIDVDLTERKRAEKALRESEARFRTLAEHIPGVVYLCHNDEKYSILYINAAIEHLTGYPFVEFYENRKSLADLIHPDDVASVRDNVNRAVEKHEPYHLAYRIGHKDGVWRWIEEWGTGVYDGDELLVLEGFMADVTERKHGEEEKERLQERLLQVQKLESIGRLAGGVAHDFNNKLVAILGYTELAMEQVGESNPLYEDLQEIRGAAEHSAALTRQLLAFARKQVVTPRVLEVNETVEGMLKMLRRLIGEDVELCWAPGPHKGRVRMDASQIDQILVNLCVNARDTLDKGGVIRIETAVTTLSEDACAALEEAVPGDYLVLTVSDNGAGMSAETLERVFEPFFTTKEVGKGTGLGLATVYGIVKQNKGIISVKSDLEQGTVFNIYLPLYTGVSWEEHEEDTGEARPVGEETILVVEDEPVVLRTTRKMLERQGYSVFAAASAAEAMRIAREHPAEIHLLMTDVVMPKMNGRELAKKLLAIRPDLKRLFMSGYSASILTPEGVLEDGIHFIQKPFSLKTLSAKVRDVLDES